MLLLPTFTIAKEISWMNTRELPKRKERKEILLE